MSKAKTPTPPADRRHGERRLPPDTCARLTCHHPKSQHTEGMGGCVVPACACAAYEVVSRAPAAKPKPTPKPTPTPARRPAPRAGKKR